MRKMPSLRASATRSSSGRATGKVDGDVGRMHGVFYDPKAVTARDDVVRMHGVFHEPQAVTARDSLFGDREPMSL